MSGRSSQFPMISFTVVSFLPVDDDPFPPLEESLLALPPVPLLFFLLRLRKSELSVVWGTCIPDGALGRGSSGAGADAGLLGTGLGMAGLGASWGLGGDGGFWSALSSLQSNAGE